MEYHVQDTQPSHSWVSLLVKRVSMPDNRVEEQVVMQLEVRESKCGPVDAHLRVSIRDKHSGAEIDGILEQDVHM